MLALNVMVERHDFSCIIIMILFLRATLFFCTVMNVRFKSKNESTRCINMKLCRCFYSCSKLLQEFFSCVCMLNNVMMRIVMNFYYIIVMLILKLGHFLIEEALIFVQKKFEIFMSGCLEWRWTFKKVV